MKKTILFLSIVLFSLSIFAQDRIVGVKVKGNLQTQKCVVLNLMNYRENMKVDLDAISKGQDALLNSGLFSNVYMSLDASGSDYVLIVDLKEKKHLYPTIDLEKGVGIENNDLFGLAVGGYVSLRLFNLSPFETFFGGYSVGLNSSHAFGTPFSFDLNFNKLEKLWWQRVSDGFYYNSTTFNVGIGYSNTNFSFMTNYIYETISSTSASSVKTISLSMGNSNSPQIQDARTRWLWRANIEHGLNATYTSVSVDVENYHRIVMQIYTQSRIYSVFNVGDALFNRKLYFGQSDNLKGYDQREFDAPFMTLFEMKLGVPFTLSFGLSKSFKMNFFTPELILQTAFISGENTGLENFKPSIGLGIKLNTPFGVVEPEVFFGKEFGFYFDMK